MKKSKKNYNIGLDIGTTSVGWVVTNEKNEIVKVNSKRHFWGSRLFEAAVTTKKQEGSDLVEEDLIEESKGSNYFKNYFQKTF